MITGVTGQDGSYLAEYLLSLGYMVIGLKRRTSVINTVNIDHIFGDKNFRLEYYDLEDMGSVVGLIRKYEPDEFYHLAAQSHVKVSFDVPVSTVSGIMIGTLNILETLKNLTPQCKFYFAGSSEMFGDNPERPQNELTAFSPASPYGCAKAGAFYLTRNYRMSYGMFACSGILYNHECVEYNTPILTRKNGFINVERPVDLISLLKKGKNIQSWEPQGYEIWDGEKWTKLKAITATKIDKKNKDHNLLTVQTRGGVINCTSHHSLLYKNREEVRADVVSLNEELLNLETFPSISPNTVLTAEMAELFGYLVADGHVPKPASQTNAIQFTNNDQALRARVSELWKKLFQKESREGVGKSGFISKNNVHQLYLKGAGELSLWFRRELYNKDGFKKVPKLILNSTLENQKIFLDAYYCGDGLKASSCEAFTTNSSTLAQGLIWIYNNIGKKVSIYVEHRNEAMYYRVNVMQPNKKGNHRRKNPDAVRKITKSNSPYEWVFDLETESGVFSAGVGRLIVHNSPRRGETFLTRKVTLAAARIKEGLQDLLLVGNLDASRDWGYAKEYVECMHKILQHHTPEDFVISTGETHTVREWISTVFDLAGMSLIWKGEGAKEIGICKNDGKVLVRVNSKYYRPHEVPYLLGDSTKARTVLGWSPQVTFKQLAKIMLDSDLKVVKLEKYIQNYKE